VNRRQLSGLRLERFNDWIVGDCRCAVDDRGTILDNYFMQRKLRRQYVQMGSTRAVKIGAPGITNDLYYWTMEMGWPAFVALVAVVFVAINLLFGLIYVILPGTISNAAPGSFLDGFFFSVETLATVGYGNMAPATHLGHAIASIEIMIGLFFSATVTGLVFARFARPRDNMLFSDVAVIGDYQDKRALMVRLAPMHARPLANATAEMSLLQRTTLPNGREFAGLMELPLLRTHNPMLNLSWTLIHLIDDTSPVLAALSGDQPFLLTVTVNGSDTLLARQALGGRSYQRNDVMIDHHFVDVITNRDGTLHLDVSRLSHVEPMVAEL
jgi:inward rectifier potassium channel